MLGSLLLVLYSLSHTNGIWGALKEKYIGKWDKISMRCDGIGGEVVPV